MLWRYHAEPYSLWKRCIDAKYSKKYQGNIPVEGKNCNAKAPWHAIKKWKDWFESKIKWTFNDGSFISFWHSNWYNDLHLSHQIPRFYALSNLQNAIIKEAWDQRIGDWNISPRRSLNDRKNKI